MPDTKLEVGRIPEILYRELGKELAHGPEYEAKFSDRQKPGGSRQSYRFRYLCPEHPLLAGVTDLAIALRVESDKEQCFELWCDTKPESNSRKLGVIELLFVFSSPPEKAKHLPGACTCSSEPIYIANRSGGVYHASFEPIPLIAHIMLETYKLARDPLVTENSLLQNTITKKQP